MVNLLAEKVTDNTSDVGSIIFETLTKAGNEIMSLRESVGKVIDKESNEIVTPADIKSNQIISKVLAKYFPEIPIYSEESSKSVSATRWILDPLDGTTPWVWGNSGFSISLALEKDSVIEIGAVYDPVMKEFFYAGRGMGAKRNGEIIRVSDEEDLNKMFFVVDWGNKNEKRAEGLEYFKHFFLPEMFSKRIVPQFAPALGLCKIAEGRIHALVCNDTWVEDHSAGSLILREAGGFVSNFYNTGTFKHRDPGIIAANNETTHQLIVSFLKPKVANINKIYE